MQKVAESDALTVLLFELKSVTITHAKALAGQAGEGDQDGVGADGADLRALVLLIMDYELLATSRFNGVPQVYKM